MDEVIGQGAWRAPEGFTKLDIHSGFVLAIGPVYLRRQGDVASMGIRVGAAHLDGSGACHPGALATFADMQFAAVQRTGIVARGHCPTVSLSVDCLGAALLGDWIECEVDVVDRAHDLYFTRGVVRGPRGAVARTSAVFAAPRSGPASWPARAPEAATPTLAPPPERFEALNSAPGFAAAFGPLFRGPSAKLGFRVEPKHANIFGACHGGAIANFAGEQVRALESTPADCANVSLAVDYLAPARVGDWIEAEVTLLKATRRYVFTQAILSSERGPVARANAIYATGLG